MENNQRNSRKRLNSLILLVAFTAVMLIVSTYAWFSTQKNVTLSGIQGEVHVAEGLQISLDAKTWKNEIVFSDFDEDGKSTEYLPDGGTLSVPVSGKISNVIPGELLPASGTGVEDINTNTLLTLYRGTQEDGNKLESIAAINEADATKERGIYAIDLFLQNSTAGNAADTLQLESNSSISVTNADTGLQNTLRVALALSDTGITVNGQNDQDDILGVTAQKLYDIAIWEPNANDHSAYVQNNMKVSSDGTSWSAIEATTKHNTWGVTKDVTDATIADVYVWKSGTGLGESHTLQTDKGSFDTKSMVSASNGTTTVTLPANKYIKARMYIWLEGQDVDCINQASYGGTVTVNFGFSKPGTQQNS